MIYRCEDELIEQIARDMADVLAGGTDKDSAFIVIDGRCGAGKTTFAEKIGRIFSAPVIHIDDFYLPKEKRTPERMEKCGGNIDDERFYAEVLYPLLNGEKCAYRPYDCGEGRLCDAVEIPESKVYIIEGTYAAMLCPVMDITVFMNVSPDEQLRRLRAREGEEKLEMFRTRWIPMEEKYFETFGVAHECRFVFDTTK